LATGRKLLLADDSVTVQKVVDLTFADEGVEVIAVSDGEQALSKLETLVPDVVLADVFMPKVNGYELCRYIKGQERLRHIPVMLLVGSFEPFDEVEARRAGADDYLTKPFQSIRQLVQKVGSLMGKSQPDEEPTQELQAPTEPPPQSLPVRDETIELRTADTRPLPPGAAEATVFRPKADLREQSFADLAFEEEAGKSEQSSAPTVESSQPPVMSTFDSQKQKRSFEPELAETSAGTFSPRHQTSAASFSHAAAADEALLDLGDLAAPGAAAEADDFILDLRDEAAPLGEAVFAAPEIREISQEEYKANAPTPQPVYEPSSAVYTAPQVGEPATPVFEPSPAQSSAAAASGNLSPADIDAIARRVVELMSTKVIEEIAWEVVPQLSEILIKRQLEEHGKTR
jgi:CheY-like chemotaxis protein